MAGTIWFVCAAAFLWVLCVLANARYYGHYRGMDSGFVIAMSILLAPVMTVNIPFYHLCAKQAEQSVTDFAKQPPAIASWAADTGGLLMDTEEVNGNTIVCNRRG